MVHNSSDLRGQSKARVPETQSQKLVLDGVVEKMGKSPGVAGGLHAVYQLAKYRVETVCEGEYDQQEIVVDHLLLSGNEPDSSRPGDRVRLLIKKSNTIFTRYDEDGLRKPDDKVGVFDIGENPKLLGPDCVACEPCQ